ncbi:MauE/DoxX family redox-associated membrane protein [Nocardia sp. NPDC003693]
MLIEYGIWVLRLALAVVFGLAAVGKLADPAATRKAVGEFGIPLRQVLAVARALPGAEAVAALGLLFPWTALGAALLALTLLLVFTGGMIRLIGRGEHPACSCFGAAGTAPIGRATLVRNGVLITLTLLTLAGALARPALPAGLPLDHILGSTIAALLLAAVFRLHAEHGVLRRRLDEQVLSTLGAEGLPKGAVAPEFELLDTTGGRTDLATLLAPGRHLLLVFVHPGCEMCAALARELPRWHARTAAVLTIAMVGNGDLAEHEKWGREQELGDIAILVQQGNEAALRYRVRGTPSGVLIGADGRIAAPVARGAMAVRDLISQAERAEAQPISRSNGHRVPNDR